MSRSRLLSPLAVARAGAGPRPRRRAGRHPSASAAPTVQVTTVVSGLSNPWDLTWVEPDLMLYDLKAGQVWSKRGCGRPAAGRHLRLPVDLQRRARPACSASSPTPQPPPTGASTPARPCSNASRRRPRRARAALAADERHRGDVRRRTGRHRHPPGQRAARGLPAALRHRRLPLRRHRRRRDRHQPAEPRLARRQGAAGGLGRRDPGRQPVRRPRRQRPLRLQLRPPQRAGPRRCGPGTNELWSVEHGTDRDDEVNLVVAGRELRLGPGARLRRGDPDDRPHQVPLGARRRCGARASRPSRPAAPPSSPTRAGGPGAARSPSPCSRTRASR